MTTVWMVPQEQDDVSEAGDGDVVLRSSGAMVEVGTKRADVIVWLGDVPAESLPGVREVDSPQEASDLQTAALAVAGALADRGA